ncbi:MAG: PEP-CTERM sorting domain-containing protein [Phycisphaerae bacterium]|nr:PEP-CTERM sorting domain-containing protein [Phycisphaerae bacterium]
MFYTDIVSVIGEAPVGDLYATIDITFRGTIPGGGSLIFQQDTDNVVENGTITPIPEPSTMLLLGIGLMGVAGIRRKMRG